MMPVDCTPALAAATLDEEVEWSYRGTGRVGAGGIPPEAGATSRCEGGRRLVEQIVDEQIVDEAAQPCRTGREGRGAITSSSW